jgi:Protein kinase domain
VLTGAAGTYALLEVIGRGAYGTVHKGIWRERGRHVAIKRVARALLSADEEAALAAEVDLFKHLKHENIVNYVEAIGAPGSPFLDIVMEYVEGGSLYSIVQKIRSSSAGARGERELEEDGGCPPELKHVFPERTVASFIAQVARGLDYLHTQGVVHRDIKGANILVTKDSEVKLADFGVSTRRGPDTAGAASNLDVAGTPYWMAPEIITLSGCSTVSDIWSVGCTVIELLTGFPPYHELSDVTALFRIVTDECPPLPDDVSSECQNFLRACFTKDMNARATAQDLLRHPWLGLDVQLEAAAGNGVAGGELGDAGDGERRNGFGDDDDDEWDVHGSAETGDVGEEAGLNRFEEADDEEFDDFDFGNEEELGMDGEGQVVEIEAGAAGLTMSTEALPLRSAESSDIDPFMGIMADPEAERETEKLHKHRELWQRVKTQAAALGGPSVDAHVNACNALVAVFAEHPEQRYCLVYDPGLLPILEVLESGTNGSKNNAVIEAILRVALSLLETDGDDSDLGAGIPTIPGDDAPARNGRRGTDGGEETYLGYPRVSNIRHDMCLAGFLPAVIAYCDRSHPIQSRVLAGRFIEEMLRLQSTLHMFAACRGFTVFVDMLEPDSDLCGELPTIALSGIETLLSMEKQRHKRDFCRRFAWCGLLERIVMCMDFSVRRLGELSAAGEDLASPSAAMAHHSGHVVKLARLLQTFAARADPAVKSRMSLPTVIGPIIRHIVSRSLPSDAVQPILCCVRDLSRDPLTHSTLQAACAIEVLVQYLSSCPRTEANTKTRHYIISCLHNMCIVSPARQEAAAASGLVPHLQTYIRSNDMNLRSLCIDIYSGLACSGHATRIALSKHSGVDFYVELLRLLSVPGTVRKWQARVLKSLAEWLEDESEKEAVRVEGRLLLSHNCDSICRSLAAMRVVDVEAVLEPYLRIIQGSSKLNRALGASLVLLPAMVSWLQQMYRADGAAGGPRGRLLLLQILHAHARLWTGPRSADLDDQIASAFGNEATEGLVAGLRALLTDSVLVVEEAIVVREQASRLLTAL